MASISQPGGAVRSLRPFRTIAVGASDPDPFGVSHRSPHLRSVAELSKMEWHRRSRVCGPGQLPPHIHRPRPCHLAPEQSADLLGTSHRNGGSSAHSCIAPRPNLGLAILQDCVLSTRRLVPIGHWPLLGGISPVRRPTRRPASGDWSERGDESLMVGGADISSHLDRTDPELGDIGGRSYSVHGRLVGNRPAALRRGGGRWRELVPDSPPYHDPRTKTSCPLLGNSASDLFLHKSLRIHLYPDWWWAWIEHLRRRISALLRGLLRWLHWLW